MIKKGPETSFEISLREKGKNHNTSRRETSSFDTNWIKKVIEGPETSKDLDLKKKTDNEIESFRKALKSSEGQRYLEEERGISLETAEHFGVGFAQNTFIGNRKFKGAVVFPLTFYGYSARDIYPVPEGVDKAMKSKGCKDFPFHLKEIIDSELREKKFDGTDVFEPIIVVEGQMDVLSIYEATGIEAVSLNGKSYQTFINAYKEASLSRPVIVALDNDKEGRKSQKELIEALKTNSIKVIENKLEWPVEYNDANGYFTADKNRFRTDILEAYKTEISEFDSEFNENYKEQYLKELIFERDNQGVKTGFEALDSEDFLGLLRGGIYFLGGIPALGKSTFALQIATFVSGNSDRDVIYFSLEMPKRDVITKSISAYTFPKSNKDQRNELARSFREIYKTGPNKDERIDMAIDRYFKDTKNLKIIDHIVGLTAQDIKNAVKEHLKHRREKLPPVVIIDYLQIIQSEIDQNGRPLFINDKQKIDNALITLKALTSEFNIPMIILSSTSRESYKGAAKMSAFKESGSIEFFAECCLFLENSWINEQADSTKKEDIAELLERKKTAEQKEAKTGIREVRLCVLKNRYGKKGNHLILNFYPKYNYFEEIGVEIGGYGNRISLEEYKKSKKKKVKQETFNEVIKIDEDLTFVDEDFIPF